MFSTPHLTSNELDSVIDQQYPTFKNSEQSFTWMENMSNFKNFQVNYAQTLSPASSLFQSSPYTTHTPSLKREPIGLGEDIDIFWNKLNFNDNATFNSLFTHEQSKIQVQSSLSQTSFPQISPLFESFDDSEFDKLINDMEKNNTDHPYPDVSPIPSLLSSISPKSSADSSFLSLLQDGESMFDSFAYVNQFIQSDSPLSKLNSLLNQQRFSPYIQSNHHHHLSNTKITKKIDTQLEKFACHHTGCSKKFTSIRTLDSHQKCHSEEREFVCSECTCRFKRLPDLNRHIRSMHVVGDRGFNCQLCFKSFPRSDGLKRHMNQTNKKSKFMCKVLATL